jgi:RHS repeat-associated protein
VKRTLNNITTYYIYDGEKPIVEYNVTGGIAARNLYGKGIDEILMRIDYTASPALTIYYQQDHEGSVTQLTDSAGVVIESYRYDAFGAPTIRNASGTVITPPASAFGNRFMFTGREYAQTFGIYEYRARAYHPGLGRFTSEDPMGYAAGDYNLFRYCHNDPEDRVDPMGLYEIMSGFTDEEGKRLEAAQPKLAESAAKTAEKIDKALAAGEKSKEFQSVKKEFEKITGKGSGTVEHMQRASQLAKQVAHAFRDNGKDGYKIFPEHMGKGDRDPLGRGDKPGYWIRINVDKAFNNRIYSIKQTLTHESLHNAGLLYDYAYKWDHPNYEQLTPEKRSENPDNIVDLFEHL